VRAPQFRSGVSFEPHLAIRRELKLLAFLYLARVDVSGFIRHAFRSAVPFSV